MATDLTPRHLELLRDVANADGGGMTGHLYVYAYLPMWRQYQGVGWEQARIYVTAEPRHTPGLCSEVTGAARFLMRAGLIELGESGRRRAERPLILTAAGNEFLAGIKEGS